MGNHQTGLPGHLARKTRQQWNAASARQKTALMALATGVALLALFMVFLPQITDRAVSVMLRNASPPGDDEYPAVAAFPVLSTMETGAIAGQGKGLNCSIPTLVELTAFRSGEDPGRRYRQACVNHDLCYRHGAITYGYTQADCDLMLIRDAFRLCRQASKRDENLPKELLPCVNASRKVYAGVFAGGASSFRPARPAEGHPSAFSEFDPWPLGTARYATPRVVIEDNEARLLFFLQRPGGSRVNSYRWTGQDFALENRKDLPGRYRYLVAPPLPLRRGEQDVLVWWRRTEGQTFPTGGVFETSRPAAPAVLRQHSPQIDPGGSQFYPVSGQAPDSRIHLLSLPPHKGGWVGCGDADGTQIVHAAFDPDDTSGASFTCTVFRILLGDGSPAPRGFFHIPPLAHFEAGHISVRLYRRSNAEDLSYTNNLSTLRINVPLAGAPDTTQLTASPECWRVPETAEPFFSVGTGRRFIAGFVAAKDGMRVQIYAGTGSNCRNVTKPRSFLASPDLAPYVRGRAIHVSLTGHRAGTDLVLAPRVVAIAGGKGWKTRAEAILIWIRNDRVIRCDRYIFPVSEEHIGTRRDAVERASASVPIIADLNADTGPDIVVADTLSGGNSRAFLGIWQPLGPPLVFRNGDAVVMPQTGSGCKITPAEPV